MLTPIPQGMTRLVDWLLSTVEGLPGNQAQIVLNIDNETVAWEVKTVTQHGDDDAPERERVERKRSGKLRIIRSVPTK